MYMPLCGKMYTCNSLYHCSNVYSNHKYCFCDTARAVLWNNLPVHLRCTESVIILEKNEQLKTHLF